jgi:hypothetical protein
VAWGSVTLLFFNVFVLIAQLFHRVPALQIVHLELDRPLHRAAEALPADAGSDPHLCESDRGGAARMVVCRRADQPVDRCVHRIGYRGDRVGATRRRQQNGAALRLKQVEGSRGMFVAVRRPWP